ncbi:MAG TPA: DUF4287 domain-containing protein [Arthrobacter sp.]|nr:DUF4287 domain-containing protein [Arthrobacter sp.]
MSFQAYLDTIEDKTGLTPRQFLEAAERKGLAGASAKAGAILDWLKADYGLGRGHGMALVHVLQRGPGISSRYVGATGAHSDAAGTLWLDGKASKPGQKA